MPWKETGALEIKRELINDWLKKEHNITDLSTSYGVSRKTIYKWIERFRLRGVEGLEELSREPLSHPNATPIGIAEMILDLKRRKMKWGPRKILAKLKNNQPDIPWPSDSTGNKILKKHGLVYPRKHRLRVPPYTTPFIGCEQPNAVWSADYKGQFRMGNAQRCYPLTISDNYSRYLLVCWGLTRPTYEQSKPCFEWAFTHNGLPDAIRTDNGQPFASRGLGGLSRLGVWFIKLGIRPERIDPGCPEQNGRHERMHRTLKEATATPPKSGMEEQQETFNAFMEEYNEERPHEALGQKPPASIYQASPRIYPTRLRNVEYDSNVTVRYVTNRGCIKWRGSLIFLAEPLCGEYVALKQVDNHRWEVRFSFYLLGHLDETKGKVVKYKVLPMCVH
jgi:transposase InsO family protein